MRNISNQKIKNENLNKKIKEMQNAKTSVVVIKYLGKCHKNRRDDMEEQINTQQKCSYKKSQKEMKSEKQRKKNTHTSRMLSHEGSATCNPRCTQGCTLGDIM